MNFFKLFPKIDYDLNNDGSLAKIVNIFRSIRPYQNAIDDPSLYTYYEIKNGERPDVVSQQLYGTPDFYWTFFVINDFLHDGYKAWPLSTENLMDYLAEEYSGYAITTRVQFDANNVVKRNHTLVNNFQLGEAIRGTVSGAEGVLIKKDVDMNQLVVKSTNNIPYIGDVPSNNDLYETVKGLTTEDEIVSYVVYTYAEAPHHYFIKDSDGVEREYSNRSFINNSASKPENDLSYISNRQYVYNLNDERSKIRVINPKHIGRFVELFESLLNE